MLFNDIDSCISELESKGYIVIHPVVCNIKKPVELAKYFYMGVRSHYNIDYSDFNWKLESMYAKTFIIQLSSSSKPNDSNAIASAIKIIDSIIKNIESYDKYIKITTLKLLIMESTAWIVDKAVSDIKNNVVDGTDFTEEEWEYVNRDYKQFIKGDNGPNLIDKLMG